MGRLDPYANDEVMKKPCGDPVRCKLPLALQKCVRHIQFRLNDIILKAINIFIE